MNSKRWIIGLSSGSSADGVDAALLEATGVGMELQAQTLLALHQPHPVDLRERILGISSGASTGDARQISLLHRLLGETFAHAARQVADQASCSLSQVQCIGCPGHTIWHDPEGQFASTLNVGMPAAIAERTGVTVVSDFRSRDIAAGGQGAPLAALVDYLLFRDPKENRLLIHLGGLARIVYLPAGCRLQEVQGYEAAPCNIFLDALMRQVTQGKEPFDPGGKHAVQGRCLERLLQKWLSHSSLHRRPPKSLPRHRFGSLFAAEAVQELQKTEGTLFDLLCTGAHFVARSIIDSLRRFLPGAKIDRALLSGGGARNGLLWHLLEQYFAPMPLELTDEVGVASAARKAMGFGMLAALTVDGVAGNLPSATGAVASRLLGSLTPGNSTNWSRCLEWMAAQAGQGMAVASL